MRIIVGRRSRPVQMGTPDAYGKNCRRAAEAVGEAEESGEEKLGNG